MARRPPKQPDWEIIDDEVPATSPSSVSKAGNSKASAKTKSNRNARPAEEPGHGREKNMKKLDPADNSAYSYGELLDYYRGSFSEKDIKVYWNTVCVKPPKKWRQKPRAPVQVTVSIATISGEIVAQLDLLSNATVLQVKQLLEAIVSVAPEYQRILDDTTSLAQHLTLGDVSEERNIHLTLIIVERLFIISASEDGSAKLWSAYTGRCRHSFCHSDALVSSGAHFSRDGTMVVTASFDKTAKIWDVDSGDCLATLVGHSNWVNYAEFSPDARMVATCSRDETVRVWCVATGGTLCTLSDHNGNVVRVTFSPDGNHLATCSYDKLAILYDVTTGCKVRRCLRGHESEVISGSFSPDSQYFITACVAAHAIMWCVKTATALHTFHHSSQVVYCAHFSHDGQSVVTAGANSCAKVWSTTTGQCTATLNGHTGHVLTATFSPDNAQVVTAADDKTARVWNVSTGECVRILKGHGGTVNTAQFSLDGSEVVTASNDKTVKIWNTRTGAVLFSLTGHTESVWSAFFSRECASLA